MVDLVYCFIAKNLLQSFGTHLNSDYYPCYYCHTFILIVFCNLYTIVELTF